MLKYFLPCISSMVFSLHMKTTSPMKTTTPQTAGAMPVPIANNLTTEDGIIALMKSSKTAAQWNANCDKVITFEDFELATKACDAVFSQVVTLANHPAISSYTRHCGEHAVELAEGDLLGEALAALETLLRFAEQSFESLQTPAHDSRMIAATEARAILAKAGKVGQ